MEPSTVGSPTCTARTCFWTWTREITQECFRRESMKAIPLLKLSLSYVRGADKKDVLVDAPRQTSDEGDRREDWNVPVRTKKTVFEIPCNLRPYQKEVKN